MVPTCNKKSKSVVIVLLSLTLIFVTGCVAGNPYASTFGNAVASGKSEVLYSSRPFDDFLKEFTDILASVGYERAIYKSPDSSFFVAVKNVNIAKALLFGDATSHKILIRLTEWGNAQTRIDLVNGTTYIGAKGEVEADIKSIAQKVQAAEENAK